MFRCIFLFLILFMGGWACSHQDDSNTKPDGKLVVTSKTGQKFYTGLKIPVGFQPKNVKSAWVIGETLPESFDWRTKATLSPIENQGSCGSCWAFSTAATFQDVKRIFGETEDLSEQYLLSCANPSEWTCNGGFFAHDAHKAPRGGVLASEYPYTGTDSTCKSGLNYRWKLTSWAYLPGGETPSVQEIKSAIFKYGPLSVGVAATDSMSNYRGGIWMGDGSTSLNHAVGVVGWGKEGGQEYFIMRNSWGAGWGENGFMRLAIVNGKAVNGFGAWANFVVYNTEPTPGPNPEPNPNPSPEPPPPPPECEPKAYADTGYGDAIRVRVGATVMLGTRARPGHTYFWTAEPAFEKNATPKEAKIKYTPRITKRLTVHAVTQCGEATDSVTVNAVKGYNIKMSPEVQY